MFTVNIAIVIFFLKLLLVYDLIFCPITELQFSNFFQTYLLKLAEMVLNC